METTDQTPLNRLNLPLESFTNQTGLGAPVGANYFRVTASNGTITGTAVATTGTVASSTSSGAAIKMVASNYLAGAFALVGSSCCCRLSKSLLVIKQNVQQSCLDLICSSLVEYRNRGYVQSFHAHLVSLYFIEQFDIAQLVPTSGGAINFAALADKYGLSEADVCCLAIWEG